MKRFKFLTAIWVLDAQMRCRTWKKGLIFISLLLLYCLQVNGQHCHVEECVIDSCEEKLMPPTELENVIMPVQVETQPDNLLIKETKVSRPGAPFFVVGGIAIVGGVAGTFLSVSGPKVKTRNGNIVKWKEVNLLYATAGIVIGGACIGTGIGHNKKAKKLSLSSSFPDNNIRLPTSKEDLHLNVVVYGNEIGFRLTF